MSRFLILIASVLCLLPQAFAQQPPFQLALQPVSIPGLPGLHAFAWGSHEGKWLVLGGRADGLHRRTPMFAFDADGRNTRLLVIDPVTRQHWQASLQSLPTGLQEQLSATNMEFHQNGSRLYVIGGYGFSPSQNRHTTYPFLTAVDVPGVIGAIIAGKPFEPFFRQITDSLFAVTGGYLSKIYDTWYLSGGQKFIGRYNPMGPDHGPGFFQQYTEAIRRFRIDDNGKQLNITHLPAWTDAANLHRRDLNVVPRILPNGQQGATIFSGVFQHQADLPFLSALHIDSAGYGLQPGFAQYYNHYHCAHLPLYSKADKQMHTVFFGGMAQYYDSAGQLIRDDRVPFVRTIARLSRDSNGAMAEYLMPLSMPGLMGSGSEFIPLQSAPRYPNGVLDLDALSADTTLVGHIYGGIHSSAPNIFETNSGSESGASAAIYRVLLVRNAPAPPHILNRASTEGLQLHIYPDTQSGFFTISYHLSKPAQAGIRILDSKGRLRARMKARSLPAGDHTERIYVKEMQSGGLFNIRLQLDGEEVSQQMIIEP